MAHGLQSLRSLFGAVPAGHSQHRSAPCRATQPVGHVRQPVRFELDTEPAGHWLQLVAPAELLNSDPKHGWHCFLPTSNVPAGQIRQSDPYSGATSPLGHAEQEVEPEAEEVPGAQGKHAWLSANVPAGQVRQDMEVVDGTAPAAQAQVDEKAESNWKAELTRPIPRMPTLIFSGLGLAARSFSRPNLISSSSTSLNLNQLPALSAR